MSEDLQRERRPRPKRITARTYAFCIGDAPIPAELITYRAVEKFGVKAVFGKDTLTPSEITGMRIADTLQRIYAQREANKNVAEWTQEHPKEHEFLEAARRIWQTQ